jgi:hypothetical protein
LNSTSPGLVGKVKGIRHSSLILLVIPLVLSAFTHIWNPIGFPAVYVDEDIYMRHTMHTLDGFGPQEFLAPGVGFFDHPYFGWLFLAGVLGAIGYPDSLHPSADGNVHSVEMLYLVPRILMGILAIVDTFLIYKITERQYNRTAAFIASILFAVMPMTWMTRWIVLDPIQLPFLLSSILFAVYIKNPKSSKNIDNKSRHAIIMTVLSGIFLGLAIFTKIPAFSMVPLVAFLVYRNNNNLKTVGLWFIPVILIPLIWPAYAVLIGEFNFWWDSIMYQTHREPLPLFDFTGEQPQNAINILLFRIDPVLMVLGLAGLVFAAIKRDYFLLLWIIPFLIFLYFINHVFFYYLLPLFPPFCIAISVFIVDLSNRIRNKKIQLVMPYAVISAIGIFGLVSTTLLITTNINSTHFAAAAFVAGHLPENISDDEDKKITVFRSEHRFVWILTEIFHQYHNYPSYPDKSKIATNGIVFIVEDLFDWWKRSEKDKAHLRQLLSTYNDTQSVKLFNNAEEAYDRAKYPYTGIIEHLGIGRVEIRANEPAIRLFNVLNKD